MKKVNKGRFQADFEDIYEGMEFVVELEDGSEMVAVITEIDGDKVYTDSKPSILWKKLII